MKRILTWHFPGVLSQTGNVEINSDIQYVADQSYDTSRVVMVLKTASDGVTDVVIDINVQKPEETSGTSIFGGSTFQPRLQLGDIFLEQTTFFGGGDGGASVPKNSIITIDIDSFGEKFPGSDLTVHLELESD